MLIETRDITPAPNFAGKKSSGHTLLSALKDNLDNHFDSESSVIKCFLAPDLENPRKQVLITLDFGTGISPDKIHKMYVDNYSTKSASRYTATGKRRNLGRFGNGIKNVVGRIAGSILTISKVESDMIYAVEYNPAIIECSQQFTAQVYRVEHGTSEPMIDTLRQYWLKYMIDEDGQPSSHGTMNVFRHINNEALHQLKTKLNYEPSIFERSFGASFGETYEQFLSEGDRLYVGTDFTKLQEVLPLSPFKGASEVTQFSKTYTLEGMVDGYKEDFKIKLSFYVFPDGATNHRRVSASNAGVYILRNGRLHLNKKERPISTELPDSTIEKLKKDGVKSKSNTVWDAFPQSHSRYANIRVKVEMVSDLDEAFGVNNVKTEMSLTSALDELASDIYKGVRRLDPFNGTGKSFPDERWARYAQHKANRGHVKEAVEETIAQYLHDPETLKMSTDIIAKFTKQLGYQVV